MRVVHISDCYLPRLGGIEQQVSALAQAQVAAGHEVHVITATRLREAPEANISGVAVHRLTAPLPFDIPVHPRAGVVIHERLQLLDADVVHVHIGSVSPFAWAGLRAADALGLPALTTVHSMWGPLSRALYGLGRRVLNWPASTRITAVSRAAADLVARAALADVHVIGNGVDLERWVSDSVATADRVERLRLVCATRFAPRKRVLPLLLVMRKLHAQLGPNACPTLTIAGDGLSHTIAAVVVRLLGLSKIVQLPGRVSRERLLGLYQESDVFVQLSVRESFGIAAIEARAAGLPVVGRLGTGFAEFVSDEETGFLVASDAAAAAAIARLHHDRSLLSQLQANSRRERPAQTWQQTVATVSAAYRAAAEDLRLGA